MSGAKSRIQDRFRKVTKILSRKGLYEFLEREYALIAPGARVLNVGSGGEIGNLLDDFAHVRGFEILTLDIDERRRPDLIGDICDFDFGSQTFDVVVMSEVLEHVHSPHLGIDNIRSVLVDGGKLILTTPFAMPLHDRPYDYYRFTRYGLEHLLRDFRSVSVAERNTYFEAIDVLWVRLLQTDTRAARLMSYFVIPFVFFLKRPLTMALSKLVKTDSMTTGYVVTALK